MRTEREPALDWELRAETSGELIDRATRLNVLIDYSRRALAATGEPYRVYVIVHVPSGQVVARRNGVNQRWQFNWDGVRGMN